MNWRNREKKIIVIKKRINWLKEAQSKKILRAVKEYNQAMHRWNFKNNKNQNSYKITIRKITRITKSNRLNTMRNSNKTTNNKSITKNNNPPTSLPNCSLLMSNSNKIFMHSKNRKQIKINSNSIISSYKNNRQNRRYNNRTKVIIIEKNFNKNRRSKNKMEGMYHCSWIEWVSQRWR